MRGTRAVGIYGGSFDPIHRGHLFVAAKVRDELALDQVIFVPAHQSPTKSLTAAQVADRIAMARLATRALPWAVVSTAEADRPPPSFTVDTIRAIRGADPQASLFLIVGADALADFGAWRDPDAILDLATLVAVGRGATRARLPTGIRRASSVLKARNPATATGAGRTLATPTGIVLLDVTTPAVSSREVRARVAAGEPIEDLVPEAVGAYIRAQCLYCATGHAIALE